MKKLSIMASLLLGLVAFSACTTDRDDNPKMKTPTTFTLLNPVIGDNVVDLEHSKSITLKAASQPDYGFPAAVQYGVQMSLDNDWTVVEDEEAAPKFYTIDGNSTSINFDVPAAEIDKGIMLIRNINDASEMPEGDITVYLRMFAQLVNDESGNMAYSNVVTVKVNPYYLERKAAEPVYWFLIGGCIGNGSWTNSNGDDAYLSIFPLSFIPEYEYDAKTGLGEIASTFYVPAGQGFKLKFYSNSWDEQWGSDGADGFVKNDGGSKDIKVAESGYYKLTYNTKADKITLEKVDAPAANYTVTMIGFNGDWENDVDMAPANGAGENNHMWTAQVEITEKTEFKFRANHAWVVNWGYGAADGEVNLYGFGTNGGKNIGIEPGKYTIYFNDIDGFFRILPVGEKQK